MPKTQNKRIMVAPKRIEIFGQTGVEVTTRITLEAPSLVRPIREVFNTTSGLGELRLGAQPADCPNPPDVSKLYPSALQSGSLYLDKAGEWDVTTFSKSEDPQAVVDFALPFVVTPNPSGWLLRQVAHDLSATIATYHSENVKAAWDQFHKVEQNLIVGREMTLEAEGGDIYYRWGGPPTKADPNNPSGPRVINPNGIARKIVRAGETVDIGPAPLCSLWVRAVNPSDVGKITATLLSQRMVF